MTDPSLADHIEWARAVVGRLHYRDWMFTVEAYPSDTPVCVTVAACTTVPDVTGVRPDGIDFRGSLALGGDILTARSEEALYNIIWSCIDRFEEHERMEHFKVNGQPLFTPHAPDGAPIWHRPKPKRGRLMIKR